MAFTRARPYHSDNNAHGEQKSWMGPRPLLGYDRLEVATLVAPIGALYAEAGGPLMNFFLPGLKLQRKGREKSAWKKRYEPARTAYQRLMDTGVLGRRARRELRERYESLDPFVLKADVERRLQPILAAAAEVAPRPRQGGDWPPPACSPPNTETRVNHASVLRLLWCLFSMRQRDEGVERRQIEAHRLREGCAAAGGEPSPLGER